MPQKFPLDVGLIEAEMMWAEA